jgi:hypothetical protein
VCLWRNFFLFIHLSFTQSSQRREHKTLSSCCLGRNLTTPIQTKLPAVCLGVRNPALKLSTPSESLLPVSILHRLLGSDGSDTLCLLSCSPEVSQSPAPANSRSCCPAGDGVPPDLSSGAPHVSQFEILSIWRLCRICFAGRNSCSTLHQNTLTFGGTSSFHKI